MKAMTSARSSVFTIRELASCRKTDSPPDRSHAATDLRCSSCSCRRSNNRGMVSPPMPPLPALTGERPDPLDRPTYPADLLLDLGNRPEAKMLALIGMAEGAPVPGAVPGHPDQETPGLARRTYRPLFKGWAVPVQTHDFTPRDHPRRGTIGRPSATRPDSPLRGEKEGIPRLIPMADLKIHERFAFRSPAVTHVPDRFAFSYLLQRLHQPFPQIIIYRFIIVIMLDNDRVPEPLQHHGIDRPCRRRRP